MFTNEWPLELDELFTVQNLFSEFSTVIIWQLSPGQADYYECVSTAIRPWLFLWMHFSLWITDKWFILTIQHLVYVTGHLGCTVLFLLPVWVTVASTKGRGDYDTNKHFSVMVTYSFLWAKWDFCCQEKKSKEKTRKRTIPQAFVEENAAATLLNFSWKINPKGHRQGHSECQIIQFWWTLTLLCYFVKRETLHIHNLEHLPNSKPFPQMAFSI